MNVYKKYGTIILIAVLLLFVLFIIIYHWNKFLSIIRLVFFSATFAYVLTPASRMLEKRMPQSLAIIALLAIFLGIFALLSILLIPTMIKEGVSLLEKIPQLTWELQSFLGKIQYRFEGMGLPQCIKQTLDQYSTNIQMRITGSIEMALEKVIDGVSYLPELFLIPVLGFYFLEDREHFKEIFTGIIPHSVRPRVLKMFIELHQILNQFIRSQLLISVVVGTLATLGFWVIGLPYALILGLLSGIFEIIPYFGPWIGAVPAVIIAFINTPSKVLWTVIVVILVQQMEGSIITPKILGVQVKLRPAYVILSLWVGGIFFGVIGMLFAVPVVLILRVILKNIYLSLVTSR